MLLIKEWLGSEQGPLLLVTSSQSPTDVSLPGASVVAGPALVALIVTMRCVLATTIYATWKNKIYL